MNNLVINLTKEVKDLYTDCNMLMKEIKDSANKLKVTWCTQLENSVAKMPYYVLHLKYLTWTQVFSTYSPDGGTIWGPFGADRSMWLREGFGRSCLFLVTASGSSSWSIVMWTLSTRGTHCHELSSSFMPSLPSWTMLCSWYKLICDLREGH